MVRSHQAEQRLQRRLGRSFIGPDHQCRGKHVDASVLGGRDPGGDDSVEAPDGEQIDVILPLVGGDQSPRRGLSSAAVQDKPIGDHVQQQLLYL
jgi:hypothetical protein